MIRKKKETSDQKIDKPSTEPNESLPLPEETNKAKPETTHEPEQSFPIVGIGASGWCEAEALTMNIHDLIPES